MKSSWFAAGVVVILLCLWMVSGLFKQEQSDTQANEVAADEPMRVEVRTLDPESMDREISLQGQLEPIQHLQLRAQTSGQVDRFFVTKGDRVNTDDPLLALDLAGRVNTLAEAEAQVKTAQSEQEAAEALRRQRLQSQLQLEQSEASLETALARLAAVRLDIDNTTLTAPFGGVVNDLPIDKGALVERGDVVAVIIDDSAFNVSAQASQQSLSQLKIGQPLSVELITGESLTGKLTFISSIADSQTRSFTVEARVDNHSGSIAAGVSASMHIPVEQVQATFISPSTLSLGLEGELGVKSVDDNNVVQFLPIELVSTSLDGAWVSGIPAQTRVITLGQGFVNVGESVDPIESAETTAATGSN